MTRTVRPVLVFYAALALAACGGGGGGDPAFQAPPPVALVPLTAANATSTASDVLAAIDAGTVLAGLGLNLTFNVIAPLDVTGGSAAARLSRDSQRMLASSVRRLVSSAAGPGASAIDTLDCLVTGSVVVTSSIATPGTLAANDTVVTAYDNCNDGDGLVLDGTLDLRVASFAGDLSSGFFVLATDAGLDQLLLTADGQSLLLDGDASLDIDTSADTILTVTIEGALLDLEINGATSELSDFLITVDADISNLDDLEVSLTGNGTLTSTALGGKVNFEIIEPLVERESQSFPEDGQIEILGANASSVTVTDGSVPIDRVSLGIDSNGDLVVEETIDTTWPELLP